MKSPAPQCPAPQCTLPPATHDVEPPISPTSSHLPSHLLPPPALLPPPLPPFQTPSISSVSPTSIIFSGSSSVPLTIDGDFTSAAEVAGAVTVTVGTSTCAVTSASASQVINSPLQLSASPPCGLSPSPFYPPPAVTSTSASQADFCCLPLCNLLPSPCYPPPSAAHTYFTCNHIPAALPAHLPPSPSSPPLPSHPFPTSLPPDTPATQSPRRAPPLLADPEPLCP